MGGRSYVVTQSLKKLKKEERITALDPKQYRKLGSCLLYTSIDWISPALSVVTEIIRRYSCDMTWISLRIQQEILLILPDIRTVQSDIKRKIAHDFHTMCVRICFYLIPLLIEDELQKLFITDFLFKLLQRKAAVANPFTLLLWPLCPCLLYTSHGPSYCC